MLLIILKQAVTVHKFQGTALNKSVISLEKRNLEKGQFCVAHNQLKTLDGIVLTYLEAS